MTRIDKYLEKYLDGSITEKETEEFRQLLASDPRLEQELGETLELRSVIHDDLLEIEPPAWLSSRVEVMVGERFAALPFEADPFEEEEEEKRRGVILPWLVSGRMAGSMAVAAVVFLMVALAPTVEFESGDPFGSTPLFMAENGTDADGSARPTSPLLSGNELVADVVDRTLQERSIPVSTQGNTPIRRAEGTGEMGDIRGASESDASSSGAQTIPAGDPSGEMEREMVALTEEVDPTDQLVAENSINDLQWMLSAPNALDYYAQDNPGLDHPARALPDRRIDRGSLPSIDEMFGDRAADPRGVRLNRGGQGESPDLAESRMPVEETDESYQRVMFGGTLASGMTSRSTGLSIEGSAYLALGLGQNSRIGLEGGSATFRHRRDVTVEILTPAGSPAAAARAVVNDDDDGKGVMLIGAGGRTGAGGESGGVLNPGGEPGNGIGEDLNPPDPSLSLEDPLPTRGRVEGYNVSYGMESYEIDASMVYGLVFYDHTVTSLSERLNLNGRIGIGGADGGMVLSARAYAAIASHENIAWTLGVGGSMLHDFAGEIDFNATYGLNAGVEFGF